MSSLHRLSGLGLLASAMILHAADPFAEGVRPTDPLTPEEQQRTFHLPPGFEVQLVASEPEIFKPLNMAFDARGRLWVTDSLEYPFPVKPGEVGRDSIKILEDTNLDGKADKITTFADGLNIPIGLYPYKNGVIAWSIPNIWYFEDTDGDDKADKRTVLFGPLGWERDTHGNIASLRRGFDGWLYGTHGFNNSSNFRGRDGSELNLQSGNVWRVRVDGSRVEPHSFGQVNPFGLAFDPYGNLYSADCHSSPIYQLIRGAYYPSFGKPHDGLGFGPTLMQHSHGSTAISGILFYADDLWPSELTNNIFVGNVMTSRINRDQMTPIGTTLIAKEMPDLVSSDDPWFRPVDLQLGPDGALYVADFYNRIIGHYEVSLTHPGRDRTRGRIWRISYTNAPNPLPAFRDLTKLDLPELTRELDSRNSTRRMLAMNEMVDRFGAAARGPMMRLLKSEAGTNQTVHALWVLHRVGGVPEDALDHVWARTTTLFRTHVLRVLSETPSWTARQQQIAMEAIDSIDAILARTAADAIGQHVVPEAIPLLIRLRNRADTNDTHLVHTARIALRNQLRAPGAFAALDADELDANQARAVADVSLGIESVESSRFLLDYITRFTEEPAAVREYLRHIATHLPIDETARLVDFVTRRFERDLDLQLQLFKAQQEGLARRGADLPDAVREWGSTLTMRLLNSAPTEGVDWRNHAVPGVPSSSNPWRFETRRSTDEQEHKYLTSFAPGAEELTGAIRSSPFTLPGQLTFYVAGHDGPPDQPRGSRVPKNLVRLRSAASDEIIRSAPAPGNDIARKVTWDLSDVIGQRAYFEAVDGDTGSGYAWIAVGRFEPAMLRMPEVAPSAIQRRQIDAAALARSLKLTNAEPALLTLLQNDASDMQARAAAAVTIASFHPNQQLAAVAPLAGDADAPPELRARIQQLLTSTNGVPIDVLKDVFRLTPQRVQARVAESLAGSIAGAETLLQLIESGDASQRLLAQQSIRDRVAALKAPAIQERFEKLIAAMPPAIENADKEISERRNAFANAKTSIEAGKRVFTDACALCHQVSGIGKVVGPQLDGIGNRGLERLLEDIIDPNRNVDVNFRTVVLNLKDDETISGLVRREEGEALVLADAGGNEVQIPKNRVVSREQSASSLMPANFSDALTPAQFNDLLAYLMSLTK